MADAVANDTLLLYLAQQQQASMNAGHVLHLYANGLTPTPDSKLRDFLEASYDGYSAQTLGGLAGPVHLVAVGVYQFDFAPLQFTCTGPNGQLVYGWWIDFGGKVRYARRFNQPFQFQQYASIWIALRPQVLDESLVGQ